MAIYAHAVPGAKKRAAQKLGAPGTRAIEPKRWIRVHPWLVRGLVRGQMEMPLQAVPWRGISYLVGAEPTTGIEPATCCLQISRATCSGVRRGMPHIWWLDGHVAGDPWLTTKVRRVRWSNRWSRPLIGSEFGAGRTSIHRRPSPSSASTEMTTRSVTLLASPLMNQAVENAGNTGNHPHHEVHNPLMSVAVARGRG